MLIVLSSASAVPGRRDELVAAARAMAAATRGDRGCLSYAFSADLEHADRILGHEVWTDEQALADHMAHDHTAQFLAAVRGLVTGEAALDRYVVAVA